MAIEAADRGRLGIRQVNATQGGSCGIQQLERKHQWTDNVYEISSLTNVYRVCRMVAREGDIG